MKRILSIYLFNRVPRGLSLTPDQSGGRPVGLPIRGGFQLFGGRTWTVSFLRFGRIEDSGRP